MRAILGEIDKKDSAYILVLRGIDDSSLRYVENHSKKYPTWGCLLFPEYFQVIESPFKKNFSPIHGVYCYSEFSKMDCESLRLWVKEKFPPYNEDDDVEIKIGFDHAIPDTDVAKIPMHEPIKPLMPDTMPFSRRYFDIRQVMAKGTISAHELFGLPYSEGIENRVKRDVCSRIMDVMLKENLIHFERVSLPMGGFEIIGVIDVVPRK